MSNKKATKRALLTSILAICLCLVMLIGSTFAWFTDTASTGVNQIVSGNLDVDIVGVDSTDHVEKLNFTKAAGAGSEQLLWEPGVRYLTEGFRIANNGNLALKWKAEINKDSVVNGKVVNTAKDGVSLLDVIDFYVVTSTDETADAVAIEDFVGNLGKTETSEVYYIKGVMKTTAGNDYQNLTLDGITITVYATQDTVEYDSFGKDYDANATNRDEALSAFAKGGTVAVSKDIIADATKTTVDDRLTIMNPTTLDLNAKIVSNGELMSSKNFCALFVQADTTINANANGGIQCTDAVDEDGPYSTYGIDVTDGATLTINGGTYYCGGTVAQVEKGHLIINGGHFEVIPFGAPYGYGYMLNCIDSAYKNGTAKITVKGGTFVNFNPADCKAEGAGTNFVAPGYTVVSEAHGSDTWYTVVPE